MNESIRLYREANRLTQEDVAKYLELNLTEYSNKELKPSNFTADHLTLLSELFDCPLERIFDFSPNETEPSLSKEVKTINYPKIKYKDKSILSKADSEGNITLFKYVPINKHLMDTVFNGSIYMSYPKDFNDPFELIGHLVGQEGYYKGYISYGSVVVAPFTLTNNSEVMWAHYAKDYSGVCLQVEVNIKTIEANGYLIGKVKYFSNIPNIIQKDLSEFTQNEAFTNKQYIKTIFQKKNIWRYENEVRIVKQIDHSVYLDNDIAKFYSNGRYGKYDNQAYFLNECKITGIIVGHYVHIANRTKIESWAKQKSIPLYYTDINKHEYKILITK